MAAKNFTMANWSKPSALRAVVLAAIVVSVLTFTPLVIPPFQCEPILLGLPRSLWAGMLVASALVGLTALAARLIGTDDPGYPS
jgi:hypothetical protein